MAPRGALSVVITAQMKYICIISVAPNNTFLYFSSVYWFGIVINLLTLDRRGASSGNADLLTCR